MGWFSNDDRRTRALHEAGHYVAGKAVGGRVRRAWLSGDDGEVDVRGLPNAKAEIVFQLAGGLAAGTGRGCSRDDAAARRALREYPPGERTKVWRDAQSEARRIVSRDRGEIRRVADRLEEDGYA